MSKISSNSAFTLFADRFVEGDQEASSRDGHELLTAAGESIPTTAASHFPQLSPECPMLDAMYGISIRDHERVTIDSKSYLYMLCARYVRDVKIPRGLLPDGSVFWAGYGFNEVEGTGLLFMRPYRQGHLTETDQFKP